MAAAGNEKTDVQKLSELIKDIEIAMLTTAMPDGSLRSRPMMTQKSEFDGVLWFFTDARAGKVHELEADSHVNLSYAAPSHQRYVSVSGRANMVQDRDKVRELWSPVHKAWFPGGPDDPSLGLLKVEVAEAEYWDSPSGAVVKLVGLAKALVTGERYQPGENEKIKM